jgi:hypothetical protein
LERGQKAVRRENSARPRPKAEAKRKAKAETAPKDGHHQTESDPWQKFEKALQASLPFGTRFCPGYFRDTRPIN